MRHTPPGTTIVVRAGPGPVIAVIDMAPSGAGSAPLSEGLGIGLTVVERVLHLNGAVLAKHKSASGMTVTITFDANFRNREAK